MSPNMAELAATPPYHRNLPVQLLAEDETQGQAPSRNQILAMALKISTHLQFPSPATKLHCHRVFSEQPHHHLPQLNFLFPHNQILLCRGSKNVGFRGVVVRSMAGGLETQTETKGRPEMFVKATYSPPSWASELHPAPSHFVSLGQVNIKMKKVVRIAHWRVSGYRMWNYVLHIGVTFFFSFLRGLRAGVPKFV